MSCTHRMGLHVKSQVLTQVGQNLQHETLYKLPKQQNKPKADGLQQLKLYLLASLLTHTQTHTRSCLC